MLLSNLHTPDRHAALLASPVWTRALDGLARLTPHDPDATLDWMTEKRMFVMIQGYTTEPRDRCRFEAPHPSSPSVPPQVAAGTPQPSAVFPDGLSTLTSAESTRGPTAFRTAKAEPEQWRRLRPGDAWVWKMGPGVVVKGQVDSILREGTTFAMGVRLADGEGRFTYQQNLERGVARIFINGSRTAYRIDFTADGSILTQTTVSGLICAGKEATYPLRPPHTKPKAEANLKTEPADANPRIRASAPAPFQSRPGAPTVIYCDFDGEVVNEPDWSPNTINAQPSGFTDAEIAIIMAMVAEDFAPFDVNVTNVRSVYNNTPTNRRVMCVTTPTDTAEPGAGGVAFLDSFVDDLVCWNFEVDDPRAAADTISHEVGHTFNLEHDGNGSNEYYDGHEADGGIVWGPIMGSAFDATLVQWSKGEYFNASQTQDDLAVITAHGLSFRTDDVGNSAATAHPLEVTYDPVTFSGVIGRSDDIDVFTVTVNQLAKLRLRGTSETLVTNLDLRMQVFDTSNASPLIDFTSTASLQAEAEFDLQPGVYEVRLQGDGSGSPLNSPPTGWTRYGSLGHYTLTLLPDPPNRNNAIETSAALADSGDAAWFSQTAVTFDGEDALQAGSITHNQSSILSITRQTTSVSFRYRVSSESDFDYLEFWINGARVNRWSGATGWAQYTNTSLSNSSHTFEWRYVKDESISEGSDTAWIDQVAFANDINYANWAAANNASADSSQDGNNNGITDLAEYALISNEPAAVGAGEVLVLSAGPTLEFYRDTTRGDVNHRIQTSADLLTWTTVAVSYQNGSFLTLPGTSVTVTSAGPGTERIQTTLTTDDSLRFGRVLVREN